MESSCCSRNSSWMRSRKECSGGGRLCGRDRGIGCGGQRRQGGSLRHRTSCSQGKRPAREDRHYAKVLLGFLPPEIAIPAASILSIDPAIFFTRRWCRTVSAVMKSSRRTMAIRRKAAICTSRARRRQMTGITASHPGTDTLRSMEAQVAARNR